MTSGLVLARLELWRLARSPLMWIASAFVTFLVVTMPSSPLSDANQAAPYPAIFLGGFGMIATYWLTTSTRASAEFLDVTPTLQTDRVRALLITAVLPLVLGVATFVGFLLLARTDGPWVYGQWSTVDRAAINIEQLLVPALGGPLLGVALGRWLRAPWLAPVSFLVIIGWALIANAVAFTSMHSTSGEMMRLFAPFAFFTFLDNGAVYDMRGWPVAFVAWQVALCGIAATAALLHAAEGPPRRRLRLTLAALGLAAAIAYIAAVMGGVADLRSVPVPTAAVSSR
jgi:hypothetical protein